MDNLEVRVEWTASADAEKRLRRVYDLLLREHEGESHVEPTIRELLLKGLVDK